jgi:exosortase
MELSSSATAPLQPTAHPPLQPTAHPPPPALWSLRFAPAWLSLVALLLLFAPALIWLVGTWSSPDYGSSGFLALVLLVAFFFIRRARLRPRTVIASRPLIGLLLLTAGLEVFFAPLEINVLSAALAIVALHLWSVAFFEIDGSWYAKPQLYVALCSLPVVHWGNTLFGFHLQQFATRLAGAALSLYGAAVEVDGTLLRFAHMVVAVDESCSGMRLLMGALLFGLLAQPQKRRVLFWIALFVGVLLANVMRVMALALAHLWLAGPPSESFHQGVGLGLFALVCAALLSLFVRPTQKVAR